MLRVRQRRELGTEICKDRSQYGRETKREPRLELCGLSSARNIRGGFPNGKSTSVPLIEGYKSGVWRRTLDQERERRDFADFVKPPTGNQ